MRGSEEDFVAVRTEKGAGGLAAAWRHAIAVAGFEVEKVNLVEWVARLAFALENKRFAVGREIAFAAAPAFKCELADL